MNSKGASSHAKVKYSTYAIVWIGLIALTLLTVTISRIQTGGTGVFIPLLIASLKASLVLSFFMHLRYERTFLKIIVLIMVIIFFILIWLVFFDVAYR